MSAQNKSTQKTLQEFFALVIRIISEGTSDNYSVMVLENFVHIHQKKYPFVKYIHIKPSGITIDDAVNQVNPKKVAAFIETIMDTLFSQLFKHLVKKKMTLELYEQMRNLGVAL